MRFGMMLAGVCLAGLCGAQDHDRREAPEGNPLAGKPEAVAAGGKLYAGSCGGCHGQHGDGGRGPALADGAIARRLRDPQLFAAIKNGVRGTDMPPFHLEDEKIWQLVAFVRSMSAPAAETNVPGDPEAGQRIFFGKGGCAGCHMVRGEGGYLGPDLSNIGMSRSWKQLHAAVLDPKSVSAAGFEPVTVIMKSGEKIEGVAKNRTNYSVQVQDSKGALHLLEAPDIREIRLDQKRVMPGDIGQRLTNSEIEDVLAYLSRQTVRPPDERARPDRGRRRS